MKYISFFFHSWRYERTSGVTYFARDPLHSHLDECQNNEIYILYLHKETFSIRQSQLKLKYS